MRTKLRRLGLIWVGMQFTLIGGWVYLTIDTGPDLFNQWFDSPLLSVLGLTLIVAGSLLSIVATFTLGSNLTPLPEPKPNAQLVNSGLYGRVRHPVYGGITLILWGITIPLLSWKLFIATTIITLFFIAKSIYEERWLVEQYPEYADYCKRTWRFIPKPY
ncbi:MAG: isoprenylcysteine carboxylmethyltransferase family protein [Chlorobi bacterium]|nr:isoprenylcysteine carboxylmethyltransferase family protein [Chlorobiota bacterium]